MGVEGGSGLIDVDGSIQIECDQYISDHPSASFQEVQEKILYKYPQSTIYTAISPRVFEAALLKTCQILTRGDYSGVIKPDIHYIPINPDFSDYKETIEKFKDVVFRKQIIENAFNDICISDKWKYESFVKEFDAHLDEVIGGSIVLESTFILKIFSLKNRIRSFLFEFRDRIIFYIRRNILKKLIYKKAIVYLFTFIKK